MSLFTSISQASLVAAILGSTIGTYLGVSPPNPNSGSKPKTGDAFRVFTHKHIANFALIPIAPMALHTCGLVCSHPNIPSFLLGYGAENGLNTKLITWSSATAIPLALLLCAGIPLRLGSYSSLGKNFTFALAEPDRLTTTGVYRYLQHPSYTGLVILVFCNAILVGRIDGALSCWFSPRWYEFFRTLEWSLAPMVVSGVMSMVWKRVQQEESMLQAKFGPEWEAWHAQTSRFIPFVF